MLDRSVVGVGRTVEVAESASPADIFASYVGIVIRQIRIILVVTLSIFALGILYVLVAPPDFTAQATLVIDPRGAQSFQESRFADPSYDSAGVESQVSIIRSKSVALAVIDKLNLTSDSDFLGRGLMESIVSLFYSGNPQTESELLRAVTETFANRLTVRRDGLSYTIDVYFLHRDPERAAEIANAITEAYINSQLQAKYQAAQHANVWLRDRIQELSDQALSAARAVVDFRSKNDMVSAGGRLINDQQLSELNSKLVDARSQTSEAKAKLDRIEAVLSSASPDAPIDQTVADALKNDVVSKLRSQYLELGARISAWALTDGPTHMAVTKGKSQMAEIRNAILDELKRLAETYRSDYEIATRQEAGLQQELARVISEAKISNQAQVVLSELESKAATFHSLYDSFLQRYIESIHQQSFPIAEARVVTVATPPLKKSHPKTLLILVAALGGGGIVGIGVGVLRDRWHRVFRTSAEVEDALQAPCLAVVPELKTNKFNRVSEGRGTDAIELRPDRSAPNRTAQDIQVAMNPVPARTIACGHGPVWQVADAPLSRFTEAIRSIKWAADFCNAQKPTKILGITSALADEGKSTIATSLALLMSYAGVRTLLVDCDLRNPSLTAILAPGAKHGIRDVISGAISLKEAVWTDRSSNLEFLPGTLNRGLSDSAEFLASSQVKQLFDDVRKDYDYAIVDLSPLLPVVDARATGNFIDAYIFVTEWGRTRIDAVEHALGDSRNLYHNLLGVVLNKAKSSGPTRYHSYRGGAPNSRYYVGGR